jgi:hypothetical protein
LENWKVIFEKELAHGRSSRLEGNEGRARVCARRAAGIAIGEFLARHGFNHLPNSTYDRLDFLRNIPGQDPVIITLVDHFLMQVTSEHTLPVNIDLISESLRLIQVLDLDKSESQGDTLI